MLWNNSTASQKAGQNKTPDFQLPKSRQRFFEKRKFCESRYFVRAGNTSIRQSLKRRIEWYLAGWNWLQIREAMCQKVLEWIYICEWGLLHSQCSTVMPDWLPSDLFMIGVLISLLFAASFHTGWKNINIAELAVLGDRHFKTFLTNGE